MELSGCQWGVPTDFFPWVHPDQRFLLSPLLPLAGHLQILARLYRHSPDCFPGTVQKACLCGPERFSRNSLAKPLSTQRIKLALWRRGENQPIKKIPRRCRKSDCRWHGLPNREGYFLQPVFHSGIPWHKPRGLETEK